MPANSLIVRMNGDSTNLQKAIQNARKSISELQKSGNRIDDIQKSFDRVSESTAPLRVRISQIKKAMEQMAVEGIDATEEGQALWQRMAEAAQQYDEMLKKIQNDTRKVSEESSNVSPISSSDEGGGLLDNVDLKGVGTDLLNKSGLGSVAPALGAISGAINPVTVGITAVGATMIASGKATAEFEKHLNSLQALTGLTDDEMKAVNDGAIEMSKGFKSSANEIVDAMKLIGSQAPELLKDSDALMKVTEAANVLSEAAEISVEDSAKAITGTMNQMGASASEATDIINTFAAASQQGSADVAYLNKAFEKSGTAASSAGMNYVELASAVEAIAPKFSSADVAGSQLASTLLKLSMSGNSDFMPSVVGMSKALENLANAEMDDVTMKQLVGESNITMLKSLIDAREQFDEYSKSLKGTNTAFEQMATNQKGFEGAITKMKSAWDAFLLTLGQSGVMEGLTDNLITVINAINEIINVVSDVIKSFEAFGGEGVNAINPLKYQIELLIKVIRGIGEVVQVVVKLIAKAFNAIVDSVKFARDGAEYHWNQVKKTLMDIGFVRAIINAFNKVIEGAVNMCNAIKKYWNKLKEFLGMKVETNINEKETKTDSNIKDNTVNNTINNSINTTSSEKSSKSKSSKLSRTEKIDYLVSVDDYTLETAEKKLSAWQSKQKTIKIDDIEGLQKCKDEIKKWQDEVTKRKLIIEFGNGVFESLNILQSQMEILQNEKKELEFIIDVNSINAEEKLNAIDGRLNALKSQEIEIMANGSIEELDAVRKEITDLIHQKYVISLAVESDDSKLSDLNKQIDELKGNILIESIKVGFIPEIEKGSKTDIENQIKKLEDVKKILFQTNADPSTVKQVEDEIKNLKKNLESEEIRLGIKPKIEEGSLNEIKKRIKEKEDEISLKLNANISPEDMKKLQSELESLRKEEREKSIEIGVTKNVATITKNSESWERGSVEDKKQSISNAQSMVKEIQENYKLKLIGKDEVESQLAEINAKLVELGLKPITLTFNDDGTLTTAIEDLERYKTQMSGVGEITSNVGNVFGSLGNAVGGTTGEVMNFAGQSMNAIAQIIPQIVSLISAKQAEALASGTASAASMPFPANIGAIASIVATLASVFAS